MTLNPWWTGWSDFAAMGGYGLYVWGSFGVAAAAVAVEIAALRWRRKALRPDAGAGAGADGDSLGPLDSMR